MWKTALNWLFSKPLVVLCIVIGLLFCFVKFQEWRIDGLQEENNRLGATVKNEREHTGKVVKAFEDREDKGNDRNTFKTHASASAAGKRNGAALAPGVRDAYQRVFERLHQRTANNAD